jgi:hypothetical protein
VKPDPERLTTVPPTRQVPGLAVRLAVVFGVTDVFVPVAVTGSAVQGCVVVVVVVVDVVVVVVVVVVPRGALKAMEWRATWPLLSRNSMTQVTPTEIWAAVGGQGKPAESAAA